MNFQVLRFETYPSVVPVNDDLTAVTVGHHLHAGLQEVGGRQLEGLAVPQGLIVAVLTGPHSQTGLHLR